MYNELYVVQCGQFPYYKIGIAKNAHERIKLIQTFNPFPIIIVITVKTTGVTILETFLHQKFKKQWLYNEWYILTNKDIKDLKDILRSPKTATYWYKNQISLAKYEVDKLKKKKSFS